MKPWVKVLLVTVLIAAPAMVLGPVLWPPAAGGPEPTGGQLPFFIVLAIMESVLLEHLSWQLGRSAVAAMLEEPPGVLRRNRLQRSAHRLDQRLAGARPSFAQQRLEL